MSHFKFDLMLFYRDPEVIEKGDELWVTMAQFLEEKDANDVREYFTERDKHQGVEYMVRPVREDLT